jgi:predicted metal-binding membrane protein
MLEALLRRDRYVIAAALVALGILAWGYTLWLSDLMDIPGMDTTGMRMDASPFAPAMSPHGKPWTAAEFMLLFVMWSIMMVGMMTPSAAPVVLLYARIERQAAANGHVMANAIWFFAGYLIAWGAFSMAATFGQWALERAALLTGSMTLANTPLATAILFAAGCYQFTPIKRACLSHCQSPVVFIQRHGGFRRTIGGALQLGLHHGAYCVGCCWSLMLVLFAMGIMNAVWLAAIAGFVLLEKLLPATKLPSYGAGAALIAGAAWMAMRSPM